MTVVAVLGLGEAGAEIVAGLLAGGAVVRAYDPVLPAPAGTIACHDDLDAVTGAELVLSVNSAADAVFAAASGGPGCGPGTIWVDLNTASPGRKVEVEEALPDHVAFVDAALMSTVPGAGIGTPIIASGPGAVAFADLVVPLGAAVTVLPGETGDAARRKLLRSVFFKGMSAAVTEAMAAARAYDLEGWMRAELGREFERLSAPMVDRVEEGSRRHAVRRTGEMQAAVDMLEEVGVPPRISAAARDWLRDLASDR